MYSAVYSFSKGPLSIYFVASSIVGTEDITVHLQQSFPALLCFYVILNHKLPW